MAKLLNKIPTNITEYPNSFKRQGAFPLEAYEVQYSLEAAKLYAETNPIAYVGQTIAVVENGDVKLYVINDVEGNLCEVGSDSAELEEIKLILNGREAENEEEAVIGLVDQVAKNSNDISELKGKVVTNNNQLENGAGYQTADDVALAISNANLATKSNTLEGYGITNAYTKDEVNAAIASMTHLSTKIVDTVPKVEEAQSGVIYLVQAKNAEAGTYIEYILVEDGETKSVEKIGSTSTDLSDYVTTGNLAEALTPYAKTSDVVANETFTNFQTSNSQAIAKAQEDAVSNAIAAVEDKGYAVAETINAELDKKALKTDLDNYYTKAVLDPILNSKADATATTEALAKKIEAATISHTTADTQEGVIVANVAGTPTLQITVDAYTKAEVYTKSDVYTKSETDNQIDAKIASVTGGESAADVKLALESYRNAINAELWGDTAASWTSIDAEGKVVYTPDYENATSRIDTLVAQVGHAKSDNNAATGLFASIAAIEENVSKNSGAISTLETSKVDVNTQSIKTLNATVYGSDENDETSHSYKIAALETSYSTLAQTLDTTVATTIPGLSAKINTNTQSVANITAVLDGTPAIGEEGDENYVPATEGLKATVSKKADKEYVDTEIAAITSVADNLVDVTIPGLDQRITNNSTDIATLVGNDKDENGRASKSIRTIAAEEINTLIAAADPEDGKTIENIANLVKYVDENAGEIAALVTEVGDHTDILIGFGKGEGKVSNVMAAINAAKQEAIDAASFTLSVASASTLGGVKSTSGDNKVTVDTDGYMSVNAINVNSLTQTAGDVLILDGGSALN